MNCFLVKFMYLLQLRHTHAAFLRLRVSSDMKILKTAAWMPLSMRSSIALFD